MPKRLMDETIKDPAARRRLPDGFNFEVMESGTPFQALKAHRAQKRQGIIGLPEDLNVVGNH